MVVSKRITNESLNSIAVNCVRYFFFDIAKPNRAYLRSFLTARTDNPRSLERAHALRKTRWKSRGAASLFKDEKFLSFNDKV